MSDVGDGDWLVAPSDEVDLAAIIRVVRYSRARTDLVRLFCGQRFSARELLLSSIGGCETTHTTVAAMIDAMRTESSVDLIASAEHERAAGLVHALLATTVEGSAIWRLLEALAASMSEAAVLRRRAGLSQDAHYAAQRILQGAVARILAEERSGSIRAGIATRSKHAGGALRVVEGVFHELATLASRDGLELVEDHELARMVAIRLKERAERRRQTERRAHLSVHDGGLATSAAECRRRAHCVVAPFRVVKS